MKAPERLSNNRKSSLIREYVRKKLPIGPEDVVLVSLPQQTSKGARFLYNLHVHGKPRRIEGDYILVALNDVPQNDRRKKNALDINAIYRIPPQCFEGRLTFTMPLSGAKDDSWVRQYRVA